MKNNPSYNYQFKNKVFDNAVKILVITLFATLLGYLAIYVDKTAKPYPKINCQKAYTLGLAAEDIPDCKAYFMGGK